MYDQGQCSRKPCQCGQQAHWASAKASTDHQRQHPSESPHINKNCCFEIAQTSDVSITCLDTEHQLHKSVIKRCSCQPCAKRQATIRGRVLSSLDRAPVVLAVLVLGNELTTFTDKDGRFSIELTTDSPDPEVSLLIEDARHNPLELTLSAAHSTFPLIVQPALEYIASVEDVQELHFGANVSLASVASLEFDGIDVQLTIPPNSIVEHVYDEESYAGSGKVLHSTYSAGNLPDFSHAAVQNLIYTDTKQQQFLIQPYVLGSLRVVADSGQPLLLRYGSQLVLTFSLKMESGAKTGDFEKLHFFSYCEKEGRWKDHGKAVLLSLGRGVDGFSLWLTARGNLPSLSPFWALGFSASLTCCVKVRTFQVSNEREIAGVSVSLLQTEEIHGRRIFYQNTVKTQLGIGACLKSVCSMDGLIRVLDDVNVTVSQFDTEHGFTMGEGKEIMFFVSQHSQITSDSKTPFYPTESACNQSVESDKGYFSFMADSLLREPQKPTILSSLQESLPAKSTESKKGFCFVKVAVYDCAESTDVKAVSYSRDNHNRLLSLHSERATSSSMLSSSDPLTGTCKMDIISHHMLRASCVQYSCGESAHISVQSRLLADPISSHQQQQQQQQQQKQQQPIRDCRYWSSSSHMPDANSTSSDLQVFQFTDTLPPAPSSSSSSSSHWPDGFDHREHHPADSSSSRRRGRGGGAADAPVGGGLYHDATSRELAYMKCASGDSRTPASTLDPYTGAAVTFTCL